MAEKRDYSEITPEIRALAAHCSEDCVIDKELYTKYKVNRGLRDLNGNGVIDREDDGILTPLGGNGFYDGIDDLTALLELLDGKFAGEE